MKAAKWALLVTAIKTKYSSKLELIECHEHVLSPKVEVYIHTNNMKIKGGYQVKYNDLSARSVPASSFTERLITHGSKAANSWMCLEIAMRLQLKQKMRFFRKATSLNDIFGKCMPHYTLWNGRRGVSWELLIITMDKCTIHSQSDKNSW